jgi:hypothetical protein
VPVVLALVVGAGVPLVWIVSGSEDPPRVAVAAGAAPVQPGTASDTPTPPTQAPAAAPPAPLSVAAAPASVAAPQVPRTRDPNGDQTPDIADYINAGEVPSMAEVISRLQAAGVSGGLGAFNPPGTRPPLVGIAVSPDVELPPGYVRHHQTTDDGQPIEPILMFAPDHPLVAHAQASARPQDRVVPPALVPPGLPVRFIVVPPAKPGK